MCKTLTSYARAHGVTVRPCAAVAGADDFGAAVAGVGAEQQRRRPKRSSRRPTTRSGAESRTGTTTRKIRSSSGWSSPAATTRTSPPSTPIRARPKNGTSAACVSGRALRCFEIFCSTPKSRSIRRSSDPFYVRITDAYVAWSRNPVLTITVGKHSVPVTQEGATSSRELLTIDRSNLANNIWFGQEYMPGVSVSGRAAPWTYRGSVYSSGAANREFGEFNGGVFTLARARLRLRQEAWRQRGGADGELSLPAAGRQQHLHAAATSTSRRSIFRLDDGRWGLRSDLSKRRAIWASATSGP